MISVNKSPSGENVLRSRHVAREERTPIVVYEISRSRATKFFAWLGKFTFIGLLLVLICVGVIWAIRWQRASAELALKTPVVNAPVSSVDGPKVMNLAFWGVTGSGVTIGWSTDKPSNTAVAYGTTSALGKLTPIQPELVTSHGVVLTGLSGGTTYYFAARSVEASGDIGYSTVKSFTTIVTAPPTISGIVVTPGANSRAQVSWLTSVPADSYVQFGSTSSYGKWSKKIELTRHPQVELEWVPTGVVHYHLVSTDSLGNQATSPDYTFIEP